MYFIHLIERNHLQKSGKVRNGLFFSPMTTEDVPNPYKETLLNALLEKYYIP
jgi:hypothetical protein